ncbi:hypothetical protein RR46_01863 [Papilio xuthus]|uniref:Uncharacterized protein n=1 Tax=Papilio xuthus TaxID=66420 RepID=A0A194QKC6_PAPXU|nr:hypothetical protein RR46_01863 [Papilio xuthus]
MYRFKLSAILLSLLARLGLSEPNYSILDENSNRWLPDDTLLTGLNTLYNSISQGLKDDKKRRPMSIIAAAIVEYLSSDLIEEQDKLNTALNVIVRSSTSKSQDSLRNKLINENEATTRTPDVLIQDNSNQKGYDFEDLLKDCVEEDMRKKGVYSEMTADRDLLHNVTAMLTKSLLCILVSLTFLKLCHGDCHSHSSDLNSRWRQVDVMEKYAHSFLQHLPVLDEETCDTQKHFVAIFSQALVEYAANNITDHISAVKEAAHNTKKLLDKSSNEVGSKLRSIISIILSIVEQPIMDIQAVCSYKVREKECSSALSSIQDARFKRCPHYSKNLAIFDGFRNLVNSCDYKQFFDRMISEMGAAILNLCNGQCYVVPEDLNTKWRPADVVEQVAHDFYQSLALGPEDNGDIEKRFVSVYSHTLFLYIASNKTDETDRIKDAAHRTRNKLDSSADQLAGPIRALISLAMLIIEGPLTDVQVACPYYVRQHECKEILSKLQADKIKQCAGYKDNIELYNRATSLINSCGMENLLEELATESNKGGVLVAEKSPGCATFESGQGLRVPPNFFASQVTKENMEN